MRRADRRAARRALPPGLAPAVDRIAEAGDRMGLGVLLVGGPVRDLLLGRPIVDVDLIVEPRAPEPPGDVGELQSKAPALRLAEAARAEHESLVAHPRFGTVVLTGPHGVIDLAGARAEAYASPGALPEVRPGTLEQDLARRDFSVNAMAIPLNDAARAGRGALVDPLGGRRDLALGLLRVLHARSFFDDPTRALRGARLAARLGFRLDPASQRALREASAGGAFRGVSGERIRAELAKLFADARRGGEPARALALLERNGVLAALGHELALPAALQPPLRWLGARLALVPAADALLAGLCAWLAPLAAAPRRRALERLALRGRPAERVLVFPGLMRRCARGLSRAHSCGAVDALLRDVPVEELLAFAAFEPAASRSRVLRHLAEDRERRAPLDGRDLAALGLSGPALGRALAALRRAFLDGECRDRAEALAWLRPRVQRFQGRAQRA